VPHLDDAGARDGVAEPLLEQRLDGRLEVLLEEQRTAVDRLTSTGAKAVSRAP
jgi:hypothetical protein